jgi:hypothetical protein
LGNICASMRSPLSFMYDDEQPHFSPDLDGLPRLANLLWAKRVVFNDATIARIEGSRRSRHSRTSATR